MYQPIAKGETLKEWYKEQEKREWTRTPAGLKRLRVSQGYGLYPFTVMGYSTCCKPDHEAKRGSETTLYVNKETDVQVAYMSRKIRFFDMSNPEDNREYWQQRQAVTAAFHRMMGWRK